MFSRRKASDGVGRLKTQFSRSEDARGNRDWWQQGDWAGGGEQNIIIHYICPFFIFVYLIFVGVVSISRTITSKIHLCWIQIPESILAAAR